MSSKKFRVWDKGKKCYLESKSMIIIVANNGDVYNSKTDEWYSPNTRYVIEYYMGIKDIKENEIYEGDIMQKCYIDFELWRKVNNEGEPPYKGGKIDIATMNRLPIYWL